jgi:tripeptidyl-peptidase-1
MFLSAAEVQRINVALKVLGTRGVSVFGASGDGGSHFSFQPFQGGDIADTLNKISCSLNLPVAPACSPYLTVVGGTQWEEGDSSKPVAWSGFNGATGGGFSWQFPIPAFQKATVQAYLSMEQNLPPAASFNSSGRAYPDIAAVASMGTSQSTPIFAGIFSMIIDHRLNSGLKSLGFLGPRIYQVASKFPGAAFKDITQGSTDLSCDNGFSATKGWDPVTGWGRPVWAGLLKYFGSDQFLA